MPGLPVGFAVLDQKLRLQRSARANRLSGDTVFRESNGSHTGHDDNSLNLDGTETVNGLVSLSFRRIDDSTFEIVSKLKINDRNLGEVSVSHSQSTARR